MEGWVFSDGPPASLGRDEDLLVPLILPARPTVWGPLEHPKPGADGTGDANPTQDAIDAGKYVPISEAGRQALAAHAYEKLPGFKKQLDAARKELAVDMVKAREDGWDGKTDKSMPEWFKEKVDKHYEAFEAYWNLRWTAYDPPKWHKALQPARNGQPCAMEGAAQELLARCVTLGFAVTECYRFDPLGRCGDPTRSLTNPEDPDPRCIKDDPTASEDDTEAALRRECHSLVNPGRADDDPCVDEENSVHVFVKRLDLHTANLCGDPKALVDQESCAIALPTATATAEALLGKPTIEEIMAAAQAAFGGPVIVIVTPTCGPAAECAPDG